MENRYRIILSNNNLYHEIELSEGMKQVKIGTDQDCDNRLSKALFPEKIELILNQDKFGWEISCSGNLYLAFGNSAEKLFSTQLQHGSIVEVHYQTTGTVAFSI